MALVSLYVGEKDIALAISSGLVGYLSKEVTTNIVHNIEPIEEEDEL